MHNRKILFVLLFLFPALVFCLRPVHPAVVLAQEKSLSSSSDEWMQKIKTERFLRLSPQEKITQFQKLTENQQLSIYAKLSNPEKEKLFAELGPAGRKSLFTLLPDEEKQKWLFAYPGLGGEETKKEGGVPLGAPEKPSPVKQTSPAPSRIENILSGRFPTTISRELKQYG